MPEYHGTFRVGEAVQIADATRLHEFRETWRFHHPLNDEQLTFAGQEARVAEVLFYHGGDPLYCLDIAPGIWHECCLSEPHSASSRPATEEFCLKEETRQGIAFVVVRDTDGIVRHEHRSSIWDGDLPRMSEVLRARSATGFASRYQFA